jgi:hypothetical protein
MDNRTFSDDRDASARMTSTMKLTFTGGSLSANSSHKTDPTHKLWCKDGSDREAPREAKRDNMHFGNAVQADGVIQFTVGGRANNPFVPASPSIYYAGNFYLGNAEGESMPKFSRKFLPRVRNWLASPLVEAISNLQRSQHGFQQSQHDFLMRAEWARLASAAKNPPQRLWRQVFFPSR